MVAIGIFTNNYGHAPLQYVCKGCPVKLTAQK